MEKKKKKKIVVGYSKAPELPQSSARPICHSHAMTRTGREPATICIAAQELAVLRITPRDPYICLATLKNLIVMLKSK